jgi:aldose 1-epimerase
MVTLPQIATLAIVILATSTSVLADLAAETWGNLPDGRKVTLYTLTNEAGTRIRLSDYGALLVSIETSDRKGKLANITLSYHSLDAALAGGVYGSIVGRFANRIGGGGFSIDGKRYDLTSTNPKTKVTIHGGKTGFHRQLWKADKLLESGSDSVSFSLESPDGHEGFPGKVNVTASYTLTDKNELIITYTGKTDQPTHLNLTNHAYFNLAGEGDILSHELEMKAAGVLELDERKLPTGEILTVTDTPFDFRTKKPVGQDIESIGTGGYDHWFKINQFSNPGPNEFAKLIEPESGRTMSIHTTKPGVQIYTANHFRGKPYPCWGGICFETQFFPDAPNQPTFASSLLRPGENYNHITKFVFGIED